MLKTMQLLRSLVLILITTVAQSTHFLRLALSSRATLSAEVLFLRKQLAFYQEHRIPPRKLTAAAGFSLVLWSRFFPGREALMIVKPETLIGWHRKGFRLWWRWKSRLGRPRIPEDLRRLMVRMVRENPTWGEERVAAELWLKLGILVAADFLVAITAGFRWLYVFVVMEIGSRRILHCPSRDRMAVAAWAIYYRLHQSELR